MFIKEEGAFRLGTQLVVYLVLGSPVIGLSYLATNLLQSVGLSLIHISVAVVMP